MQLVKDVMQTEAEFFKFSYLVSIKRRIQDYINYLVLSAAVMHAMLRERQREKQWKNEISKEKPGLSPFCLFIHLLLQNLFPLSKVRSTTKECVPSEQEKTNTQLIQSTYRTTVHSLYWTVNSCLNRHLPRLNAIVYELDKLYVTSGLKA